MPTTLVNMMYRNNTYTILTDIEISLCKCMLIKHMIAIVVKLSLTKIYSLCPFGIPIVKSGFQLQISSTFPFWSIKSFTGTKLVEQFFRIVGSIRHRASILTLFWFCTISCAEPPLKVHMAIILSYWKAMYIMSSPKQLLPLSFIQLKQDGSGLASCITETRCKCNT
jgi:hypothetical protein